MPETADAAWESSSWLIVQNRLLEMIAQGASVEEVSGHLVRSIEMELPDAMCSILALRDGRLWTIAAPSLPRGYSEQVNGVAIGPGVGSCGNTAFTGLPTIVEDIATHPFWASYQHLVRGYDLAACWSTPIKSADKEVLGTFAIYHRRPTIGRPDARDMAILQRATHIAGIALERQRKDDKLREQEQALRDADRRKDVFLASLSHELRNPLAPILSTVQLLERNLEASGSALLRHGLDVIKRQANHLTRLIDDLLDLARVAEGKITLQKEPVAIAGLVRLGIDQVADVVSGRRHHLHVDVPEEPIFILADAVRIVQVIANLLGNAAKYTPPGGDIWLGVRAADGGVELCVRDSGIGITADALARIFDLYAQASPPQPGMHGGLGIGLAVVKSMVQKHSGRVVAASEGPGRGSEFRIWLPTVPAPESSPRPPAAAHALAEAPQKPDLRVLLVDDNEDAAEMLAAVVKTTGCKVQTAATGRAALAVAADFEPDVVFLDIGLPDLSGYEVARGLREKARRRFRLIALTGYGQPSDVEHAVSAGFDQLIVKPASLDSILAVIAAT